MRSLKSASGSSTGVSAKSAPSVAGVHLSIMIPFGTSMNDRRTGRAGSAANAGVMASSTGKARAAPVPRRNARRGSDFLVSIIACSPHLKRHAFDDAENDGRPAVVVGVGFTDDLAQNRTVVFLYAAAQRVGQEPLGERLDEKAFLVEQDLAQASRAVEHRAVGQDDGRVDRPGADADGVAPFADAVEVLQRKADRVHDPVADRAFGIGAVL